MVQERFSSFSCFFKKEKQTNKGLFKLQPKYNWHYLRVRRKCITIDGDERQQVVYPHEIAKVFKATWESGASIGKRIKRRPGKPNLAPTWIYDQYMSGNVQQTANLGCVWKSQNVTTIRHSQSSNVKYNFGFTISDYDGACRPLWPLLFWVRPLYLFFGRET